MPYKVVRKPIKDARNWAIVNKNTGKIVGRSTSKAKAKASVRARMMHHNESK